MEGGYEVISECSDHTPLNNEDNVQLNDDDVVMFEARDAHTLEAVIEAAVVTNGGTGVVTDPGSAAVVVDMEEIVEGAVGQTGIPVHGSPTGQTRVSNHWQGDADEAMERSMSISNSGGDDFHPPIATLSRSSSMVVEDTEADLDDIRTDDTPMVLDNEEVDELRAGSEASSIS